MPESAKTQAGKVHPSLPKPFFQGEQEHLVFSTYLYMLNLICLLQCFPCFVLPMSRNYSSSVCLCSKQHITIALVLSSGQPNVCFLFRRDATPLYCPHSLIVFASVCPLLFMEDKTAGVQRSSLEVSSACSQVVQSLPGVWQDAFCHLHHATSPSHHPPPHSD